MLRGWIRYYRVINCIWKLLVATSFCHIYCVNEAHSADIHSAVLMGSDKWQVSNKIMTLYKFWFFVFFLSLADLQFPCCTNTHTLMSISRPATGRYGLCIVRWKFSCCIRRSSSFKIISEAFSRSPLMLATNCCIEMLNSSTLHAKYTHVTLWGDQNSPVEHSAMNRVQNGTSCTCTKLKHHAMNAYGDAEVNLHILLSLAGTTLRWTLSFTPILQGRSLVLTKPFRMLRCPRWESNPNAWAVHPIA